MQEARGELAGYGEVKKLHGIDWGMLWADDSGVALKDRLRRAALMHASPC